MQRVTITLDDDLMEAFDSFLSEKGYGNRSEAFRDLVRERLETERLNSETASGGDGYCVAALTYVFSHEERELAKRLTRSQHHSHDLTHSTLHVHLDHDSCLETMLLQGPLERVRTFGNAIIAERGVRHGNLHLVPVDVELADHGHGGQGDSDRNSKSGKQVPHVHSRPHT